MGQDQDRPEEGEADLVSDRVGPARQALGRHGGAARAGQSAGRLRHVSGLADLPDPRHQQALWRRPAGQPGLYPHVPGGVERLFGRDPGRHQGHRRRPVGQSGLAQGRALSRGPARCRADRRARGESGDHAAPATRPRTASWSSDRAGAELAGSTGRSSRRSCSPGAACRCRSPGRERLWPRPAARRAWRRRRACDSNRAVEPAGAGRLGWHLLRPTVTHGLAQIAP